MPVLEVTAAIASIIAGFVTCTKYAKDLHDRHQEKQILAAEALRLHGSLTTSSSKLFNDWLKVEQHFKGQSNHFAELIQAKKDLGLLEGNLKKSLLPSTPVPPDSCLASFHDLANRSHDLTAGVLDRLHGQLPGIPARANQLMLYSPSSHWGSLMGYLYPPNICKQAEQYRSNQRELHHVAKPIPESVYGEWECTKCKTRISKISAPLSGRATDMLWIGVEGMFKAHGPEGWSCIWRRVHSSCFEKPFKDEWELLKHMKDHHTSVHADPAHFKLQAPADIRVDCFGIGAVISGRDLQATSFIN